MKTVGIYLFNNIEVLDFAGPFEVFCTAQRLHAIASADPAEQLFKVVTIGEEEQAVVSRGGLTILPMYGIDYHPQVDVLIVPGGVVGPEMQKNKVISWMRATSERADLTASVCTGAFLLARAGVLEGRKVTTHWEDINELRETFPGLTVMENTRWVDDGDIVTSAGISAGIDMSLHVVERLAGTSHAERTARQMEYEWNRGDS